MNFYLIFHISRSSIRLILLLSYHILSYVFAYAFMYFHILYCHIIYLHLILLIYYLLFHACKYCYHVLCSYTFVLLYTFHVLLYCISCSCNSILSSHSSVMLLISYHILYTFPLHILFIFFYVHVCEYLRCGYGK